MSYWAAGDRIDANRLAKYEQAGSELISFTSLDDHTVDVTFPVEFDAAPVVTTNINSGAGDTGRWDSRAISITATGFQLFVFSGTSGATDTWTDIEVQWKATAV